MGIVIAIRAVTAAWIVLEVALVIRERSSRPSPTGFDRRSYALLSISVIAAVGISIGFASKSRAEPRLPIALALLAVGVALRLWAVQTLGRAFRVVVSISEDQKLITDGPFRVLRHPSYAGLLLALLGLGVANGTALSVAAVILLPVPAILWRIHVEEAALRATFGPTWDDYARQTRRLVPGIW